ncbi:hypothetical protein EK21DRAFT_68929, partial [Setomelanomma holmii]
MGLFSSSKIPQPPLPDIAIHLYSPAEKVFRPDEFVSGHVSFTPIIPIVSRALETSLFGKSLVWYRTSSSSESSTDYYHWRDNAPLFEVTTNLLPSSRKPTTLEVGETYIYPFSFRFPAGTGNSRIGQYKKTDDERWTVGPHDLPPSFDTREQNHCGKNGTGKEPNYSKIEYG